ncbi:MAG TPA: hypothetical protein VJT50_12340 [Pyrinomonadaceae bacterium]|nr:hypothetical protein [Pyrinomonadaceae bacterium]
MIAQRVDEAIDRGRGGWRTYQMFRAENRKALSQTMFASAALFVVVWMLLMGHGSVAFAGGFLLVMTIALFVTSLHELITRRRRARQIDATTELPAAFTTKELLESRETLDQQTPAGSVTESTTRRLKATRER